MVKLNNLIGHLLLSGTPELDAVTTEYLCIQEGKVWTDFGEVIIQKYTKALHSGGRQQQTVSEVQGSYIEILKLSFRSY